MSNIATFAASTFRLNDSDHLAEIQTARVFGNSEIAVLKLTVIEHDGKTSTERELNFVVTPQQLLDLAHVWGTSAELLLAGEGEVPDA